MSTREGFGYAKKAAIMAGLIEDDASKPTTHREITIMTAVVIFMGVVIIASMLAFCYFCFYRKNCMCFSRPFAAAKEVSNDMLGYGNGPQTQMMPYQPQAPPPMYPPRMQRHAPSYYSAPQPSYGHYSHGGYAPSYPHQQQYYTQPRPQPQPRSYQPTQSYGGSRQAGDYMVQRSSSGQNYSVPLRPGTYIFQAR